MQQLDDIFWAFLERCKRKNIPVVAAAGNQPARGEINDSLPQKLQPDTQGMIIVGAITEDGQIWRDTVHDPQGSISVYAPGHGIKVPTAGGAIPAGDGETAGTSQAAAMVVWSDCTTVRNSLTSY